LKNQINRSLPILAKNNRFFRKAWWLESFDWKAAAAAKRSPSALVAVALDSAAIAALSEENIYNLLLLAVARGVGLADLDTQWCARLRRSGPQHRRIRAHRFFRGAQAQPNMTDFRSDFQLCCGAKTAGCFARPLSAIIFANARRHMGTTACVRRCDHGADDN